MTHERIQFVAAVQRAGQFVASEIEGADDERMGLHLFRNLAISRVLLFLARQCGAVEIKKFRAVKSDAFRAVARRGFHLVGQLDVSRENNVPAIASGGFSFAQAGQLLRLHDARHSFDHRHDAADGEHHQGDEERPEVQLLAVAERVLGVRRPGATALAQVQQQAVVRS